MEVVNLYIYLHKVQVTSLAYCYNSQSLISLFESVDALYVIHYKNFCSVNMKSEKSFSVRYFILRIFNENETTLSSCWDMMYFWKLL